MINGCFDPSACTFNPDATSYVNSMCEYSEENYDCEGNCTVEIDCAGECGGSSILVNLCEDTDGDGLGNPGSETEECIEGGRDIADGCELPDSETTGYLYLTSEGSVLYKSPEAIGGFQFDVVGATVSSGSGGDAGDAGFVISTGGSTVLAFSFLVLQSLLDVEHLPIYLLMERLQV